MKRVFTKGNVEVQNIKIGDIHWEFECGCCIKSRVLTLPIEERTGYWTWESENLRTGEKINYGVDEKYSHYSARLYDHEAYPGSKQL